VYSVISFVKERRQLYLTVVVNAQRVGVDAIVGRPHQQSWQTASDFTVSIMSFFLYSMDFTLLKSMLL